jgi:hypothetical protein
MFFNLDRTFDRPDFQTRNDPPLPSFQLLHDFLDSMVGTDCAAQAKHEKLIAVSQEPNSGPLLRKPVSAPLLVNGAHSGIFVADHVLRPYLLQRHPGVRITTAYATAWVYFSGAAPDFGAVGTTPIATMHRYLSGSKVFKGFNGLWSPMERPEPTPTDDTPSPSPPRAAPPRAAPTDEPPSPSPPRAAPKVKGSPERGRVSKKAKKNPRGKSWTF